MKAIKLVLMSILLVALLGVSASALPITLNEIKLDGDLILPDHVNRLDVERGQEIDIKIYVTATEDVDDIEVEAFLSGFEYNEFDRAYGHTGPKDLDAGVTYPFKLSIPISDEFEEDSYKLRIVVSDRNSDAIMQNFNLKIDVPRHSLKIDDVVLYPERKIKAGSALLVTVRVDNRGAKDETDVKINVAIPELGISATQYIDEVDSDDGEETEEIFLKIPNCAAPGIYDVLVNADYGSKHYDVQSTRSIEVLADETCEEEETATSKTIITIGSQLENVKQGENAIFPITLTNSGTKSKVYTLNTDISGWATVDVNPGNTIVLDGGKSQTLYVYVSANENAPIGAQAFTATISTSDKVLEQITLTANVVKAPGSLLKRALEVAVVLLIVFLVIIGLIIGFSKLRGDEDDDQSETYY